MWLTEQWFSFFFFICKSFQIKVSDRERQQQNLFQIRFWESVSREINIMLGKNKHMNPGSFLLNLSGVAATAAEMVTTKTLYNLHSPIIYLCQVLVDHCWSRYALWFCQLAAIFCAKELRFFKSKERLIHKPKLSAVKKDWGLVVADWKHTASSSWIHGSGLNMTQRRIHFEINYLDCTSLDSSVSFLHKQQWIEWK